MRSTLALAAAMVAVALLTPAHAEARSTHHTRSSPSAAEINRMSAAGANVVPGFAQYLESCVVHRRMRRLFKECLTAAGIAGVTTAIGGIIAQAVARTIAGGMLGASAGACINEIR